MKMIEITYPDRGYTFLPYDFVVDVINRHVDNEKYGKGLMLHDLKTKGSLSLPILYYTIAKGIYIDIPQAMAVIFQEYEKYLTGDMKDSSRHEYSNS
jgi:hypothetical protein